MTGLPSIGFAFRRGGRVASAQARPPARRAYASESGGAGRITAQLFAHALLYLTKKRGLVFDPMAGDGVVVDTCLAFNRKCWSFDMADRLKTRPEVEVFRWSPESLLWPVKGKEKLADQYSVYNRKRGDLTWK